MNFKILLSTDPITIYLSKFGQNFIRFCNYNRMQILFVLVRQWPWDDYFNRAAYALIFCFVPTFVWTLLLLLCFALLLLLCHTMPNSGAFSTSRALRNYLIIRVALIGLYAFTQFSLLNNVIDYLTDLAKKNTKWLLSNTDVSVRKFNNSFLI